MPFCPKCKYEYKANVDVCPDCKVGLVDDPPEGPEIDTSSEADLMEVFTTYNQAEANMVKGILEENGIFCYLNNELFSGFYGTRTDLSKVVIMVKAADLIDASYIVQAFMEDDPLEPSAEFPTCSNCGAALEPDAKSCPVCGETFNGVKA
jgi:predicted amidophosphoribosyltransferase